MKGFIWVLLLISLGSWLIAQSNEKLDRESIIKEIMVLENAEVKAILESDTLTLNKIWAEDVRVNNPSNTIVNKLQVFERIKNTFIKYSLYTRAQEYFGVYDNVVVVMGNEAVVPSGNNPDKGKTLRRRYTSVYKKFDENWKLIARHANIIG